MAIFELLERRELVPNLSGKLANNAPVGSINDLIDVIKKDGNFENYNGIFKNPNAEVDRVIIYRHCDLDGAGAAASIVRFIHTDIKVIEIKCDYDMEFTMEIGEHDEVWFVDYSFTNTKNQEYLSKVLRTCPNVVWIDHHASSVKLIKENQKFTKINGIVQDYKLSGAMLVYLYIYILQFSEKADVEVSIPSIIQYTSDYDTFSFAKENTREFYYGISTIDYNSHVVENNTLTETWKMLFNADNMLSFIEKGVIISEYTKNENDSHMDYAFEVDFLGYKMLAINRRGNSFMFGDNYSKYDIVCPYYYDGVFYQYSLYADETKAKSKGFNCGELAKRMNPEGGGHVGAAGFKSDINIFEKKDSDNVKRVTSE